MATADEYRAAAEKAKAAGDTAAEARLRAAADAVSSQAAPDAEKYRAAAERARAAGDEAAAARLTAAADALAPAAAPPAAPAPAQALAMAPPRADAPAGPAAAPPVDTWTDTAGAMMEGPLAAAGAFAGGLAGGPSPSRDYLANDPYAGQLPGPVLTALGGLGDLGGAALSGIGAGLAGGIGLASELVPGLDPRSEQKLAGDVLTASQFAVPELAGASSVPARMAAAAPRDVAPVAKVAPDGMAADVAAARERGIPVLRTDVAPPKTAVGKTLQAQAERVPFGSSVSRGKQQEARIKAAQDFANEYGAGEIAPAIDDVGAALLEKRGADLKKYSAQKKAVLKSVEGAGPVPVPRTLAEIDRQIAAAGERTSDVAGQIVPILEGWKADLSQGRSMSSIEKIREDFGAKFSGQEMSAIRSAGEKALSAIYGPLREDMGAFIKANGAPGAREAWASANEKLSAIAGDLKNSTLSSILKKGEATPEEVGRLLFSSKPSDVRALYDRLPEEGRARARTAILQKALGPDGVEGLSPEKFKTMLTKMGPQVQTFFKGKDFEAANGLVRALKLTEHASKATAVPLTGAMNAPTIVGLFFGNAFGLVKGAASIVTVGTAARIYESTGVQRALRGLSKAPTPKAESTALKALDTALRDAGAPVGQAAASEAANSTASPYDRLWQKYGGAQ